MLKAFSGKQLNLHSARARELPEPTESDVLFRELEERPELVPVEPLPGQPDWNAIAIAWDAISNIEDPEERSAARYAFIRHWSKLGDGWGRPAVTLQLNFGRAGGRVKTYEAQVPIREWKRADGLLSFYKAASGEWRAIELACLLRFGDLMEGTNRPPTLRALARRFKIPERSVRAMVRRVDRAIARHAVAGQGGPGR